MGDGKKDLIIPRDQSRSGRKLHRLSIDSCPGRWLDDASRDSWVQLPAVTDASHTWVSGPKFPKLDECTHFHYDAVTLPKEFCVSLRETSGTEKMSDVFYVQVSCGEGAWSVARRYTDIATLDTQLHRCIFDRRYSRLPSITQEAEIPSQYTDAPDILSQYFERLTQLIGETVLVKCGTVLNWLEMDNKGRHFLWHVNSGINVPAIAVATVTRNYVRREEDELELRVGDLVSIIDMPNAKESPWWRGKHSNKVGFFPSSCVEVIPGSVHDTRKQSTAVPRDPQVVRASVTVLHSTPETPGVDKKKRRLKGRLAVLFASRPDRDSLRQKGILRGRVFGAHLSEHLHDTDRSVPLIVQVCCSTLESHGIVEGVYRKSGIVSNIQRLRQEFDSESPPGKIIDERYLNDIHCVASLCKMYFRELPDPLLTFQLYDQFAEAVSYPSVDLKLSYIRRVVRQLPPYHYTSLAFLARHLSVVAANAADHGMHARNLALVWAPNLLKPQVSESDSSAFTAIKIQSVVLQFLIEHADQIFAESEEMAIPLDTPGSIRISVASQLTTCSSPQDSMSQTSSVQMVHAAGFRAQRRNRASYCTTHEGDAEVSADIVRSRTTSDISSTRYQYLIKIPLMELSEAQRAHSSSRVDQVRETPRAPGPAHKSGIFRRGKKKNRYSQDYTISSSHWARSILNKFSIRRSQSLSSRPVISGPCGFVSDPNSTVLHENLLTEVTTESNSVSSRLSSLNMTHTNNSHNVLLLGNLPQSPATSLDKSDFVSEWCDDMIRQFMDGAPLASLPADKIVSSLAEKPTISVRSGCGSAPGTHPCTSTPRPTAATRGTTQGTGDLRDTSDTPEGTPVLKAPPRYVSRSKSTPRGVKNEEIATAIRELAQVGSGDQVPDQVRAQFSALLRPSSQPARSKRGSVEWDGGPRKRPLSCPAYSGRGTSSVSLRDVKRCSVNLSVPVQQAVTG